MEHDDLEFDEPALKRAVQRAWGGEQAPQRLRGRVSRLLATAGPMDGDAATAGSAAAAAAERWRSRAYALAAAAVFILSVGLLVLYYQGTFDGTMRNGRLAVDTVISPSKTAVPLALTRSMIATHAACGRLPRHHSIADLDGNTYAALSMRLTADLGFPTLARSIGPEWTFEGAGACTVGDVRGAHLLFSNGDQTVSVFSLPYACMNGVQPGAQYEGIVDDSPVAGFAQRGAVYAVLGGTRGPAGAKAAANVRTPRGAVVFAAMTVSGSPGRAGASATQSAGPSLETVLAIRSRLLEAFEVGCTTDAPDELLFAEP